MPTFYHLINHVKKSDNSHRPLYLFSVMLFFFVIFDGIISYISPIVITEAGISDTVMGIIIASSSVAGAIFDLLLCRFLKNTDFRRLLIITFASALFYPLVLSQSKAAFGFVIAMVLWGFYYDLLNLAQFDFVAREAKKSEHTSSFGVINVFKSLGYAIAPMLAGLLVGVSAVGGKPYFLAVVFFLASIMFFVVLVRMIKNGKTVNVAERTPLFWEKSFYHEIGLWWRLGKIIFPVLFFTFLLNVTDAFFWTIGPIVSEGFGTWGGLFLFTYQLPPLLVGWFAGRATDRFGKKRTAMVSFLIGSLIFSSFYFVRESWLILTLNFLASFFIAFAWPSINGAYADYISEKPVIEKELETVEDYFTNLGYVVGPIVAGVLSDRVGHLNTFSLLGVTGVVASILLLVFTPKKIDVSKVK